MTIVIAVFLATGLFCLRPPRRGTSPIDRLENPARSVVRVFERDIELEEAAAGLARGQRELISIALEAESGAVRTAIDAYRDVLARSVPRSVEEAGALLEATAVDERELARVELRARLAVLLAEDGRADDVEGMLAENERHAATLEPAVRGRVADAAAAVRCAYGLAPCAAAVEDYDLALFSPGWALERLRSRIAHRVGDEVLARELESAALARAARWRSKLIVFATSFALPLALGIGALLAWLWRGRPVAVSGTASIPPVWTFEEGFGVLVRAAGAGIAVTLALVLAARALGAPAIAAWITLCASLPMLWLVRVRLLRPHAVGFAGAFGLARGTGGPGAWAAWTLGLFAVGETGARVIHFVCTAAGAEAHWSESMIEGLFAGTTATALLDAVDAGVWAPIFEEIGCRGLLYLTLRRRSGPIGAALASAFLFGVMHQSALPHFLNAAWYGLVWAIAFERTRSLAPVIVGHALANAFVIGAVWAFYRA